VLLIDFNTITYFNYVKKQLIPTVCYDSVNNNMKNVILIHVILIQIERNAKHRFDLFSLDGKKEKKREEDILYN
jgi:hypothetical protein